MSRPFSYNDSYAWQVFISKENDKYYLKTVHKISGDFLFSAYTYLKDI